MPVAGDTTLRLAIPADGLPVDQELVVRLRFHNAVATTAAFDRTITGERLGNRIQTLNLPLATLPRDAEGAVNVTFGLTGSPTLPTVPIRTPGVYPLEVALVGEDVIEAFVTWLVVADPAAPATDTAAVNVAWVWSVVAGPVLDTDGVPYPLARAELVPGGRLDTVATPPRRGQRHAAQPATRSGDAPGVDDARRVGARARARGAARQRGGRSTRDTAAPDAVRPDRRPVARKRRARRRTRRPTCRLVRRHSSALLGHHTRSAHRLRRARRQRDTRAAAEPARRPRRAAGIVRRRHGVRRHAEPVRDRICR